MKVKAVVSFEAVRRGDVAEVDPTDRIKALIASGYLKVVEDGAVQDRPRKRASRKRASSSAGDAGRREDGAEQSEDPGSGGHGETEGVDQ